MVATNGHDDLMICRGARDGQVGTLTVLSKHTDVGRCDGPTSDGEAVEIVLGHRVVNQTLGRGRALTTDSRHWRVGRRRVPKASVDTGWGGLRDEWANVTGCSKRARLTNERPVRGG